jgi:thiol-disulfide isomerase/thioredoxin
MLAVALGFGLMGVLAGRFIDEHQGHTVQAVRVDRVWATALPDLEGRSQDLGQWRGRVVVLNFWAPWCPPCRQEIPGFIRLQQRYGAQGLQFLGVALDQPEPVRAYVRAAGINYPILLGGMAAVMLGQAAGNPQGGLPYTLILDREGLPVITLLGAVSEQRMEELIRPLL